MFTREDLIESSFVRDIYEEGKAEGRQEGLQEGLQEGQLMAYAGTLRRHLTRRFGPLAEPLEARIASAPLATLEAWFERTIDARNLGDVFSE